MEFGTRISKAFSSVCAVHEFPFVLSVFRIAYWNENGSSTWANIFDISNHFSTKKIQLQNFLQKVNCCNVVSQSNKDQCPLKWGNKKKKNYCTVELLYIFCIHNKIINNKVKHFQLAQHKLLNINYIK